MTLPDDRRRPLAAGIPASSLSPNMRRLLRRMRRLGYGTIHRLHVRAGAPVFDPPPVVVRTVRLSEFEPGGRKPTRDDFALNRQQIALVRQLAAIDTGVVDVIKVHVGPAGCGMDGSRSASESCCLLLEALQLSGQRSNPSGPERDREVPSPAVVLGSLDQQVENPSLLARG